MAAFLFTKSVVLLGFRAVSTNTNKYEKTDSYVSFLAQKC